MVRIRGSPSTSPYRSWFSCQRSTERLDTLSTAQTSSQRSGWSNRNNACSLMSRLILRWTIVVCGLRKRAGRWRIFCKISILLYMIYLALHRFWSSPRFLVVDVRKCPMWCLVKATATGCTSLVKWLDAGSIMRNSGQSSQSQGMRRRSLLEHICE